MLGEQDQNSPDALAEWLDALPGLARIAASAGWHTAGWAAGSSRRLSARVARAAVSPSAAIELADDARLLTAQVLRGLAALLAMGGVPAGDGEDVAREDGFDRDPRGGTADNGSSRGSGLPATSPGPGQSPAQRDSLASLRERGRQLIELSRDVDYVDEAHPAYGRILGELAPDEARALLLLLLEGPQPAVDVRTGGPVGRVKSKLLAPGLNMIGARAGLRHVDRVPAYLNNLFRLGLIWFSHETLADTQRYQLLEAQPDVLAAGKSVAHPRVIRRSIHLTPFGEDFCSVCLAPEVTRLEALPEHSKPVGPQPASDKADQPHNPYPEL